MSHSEGCQRRALRELGFDVNHRRCRAQHQRNVTARILVRLARATPIRSHGGKSSIDTTADIAEPFAAGGIMSRTTGSRVYPFGKSFHCLRLITDRSLIVALCLVSSERDIVPQRHGSSFRSEQLRRLGVTCKGERQSGELVAGIEIGLPRLDGLPRRNERSGEMLLA